MNIDLSWIFIGLPLAFILGWISSKIDLKQLRIENRQAPKSYFKGLNFLLNGDQDKAIDAFVEAVQLDPDTAELHFALGNLFRRRGEFDKSVRVHEHLIARADLSQSDRDRAQHALALDFLRAGLLDRAETALKKLNQSELSIQADVALLAIFERTRDWEQAKTVAQRLHQQGSGDFSVRQSHYLCEQAHSLIKTNQFADALLLLEMAQGLAPHHLRPKVEMAQLHQVQQQYAKGFEILHLLLASHPSAIPLIAMNYVQLAHQLELSQQALTDLEKIQEKHPYLDVAAALDWLSKANSTNEVPSRTDYYLNHLQHEPSLIAAGRWLLSHQDKMEKPILEPICNAITKASKPLLKYRCASCGFEAQSHYWNCPGCQSWDSYSTKRIEEL